MGLKALQGLALHRHVVQVAQRRRWDSGEGQAWSWRGHCDVSTVALANGLLQHHLGLFHQARKALGVVLDLAGHLLGCIANGVGTMSSIFLRKSADWMILTISVFSRVTTSLEDCRASTPNQVPRSNPLEPGLVQWVHQAAQNVLAVVTASARSLPA